MATERKEFEMSEGQANRLLDAPGIKAVAEAWVEIGTELGFNPSTIAFVKGKTLHHFTAEAAPKTKTY